MEGFNVPGSVKGSMGVKRPVEYKEYVTKEEDSPFDMTRSINSKF